MTREEILAAAAQIIREKGFHATSMQDLAEAVNLQKASLYHHVSSKQEILLALLDQALDLLIERMDNIIEQKLEPDEKLRKAISVYLSSLIEQRDLSSVLLLEHRSLEPVFRKRHIPRRDKLESLWRDVFQEGMEEGVFYASSAALTARTVLGVLNWTITWYRENGTLKPEELAEFYSDFFLRGLMEREV